MRRTLITNISIVLAYALLTACSGNEAGGVKSDLGESCTKTDDCESELRCVDLKCVKDDAIDGDVINGDVDGDVSDGDIINGDEDGDVSDGDIINGDEDGDDSDGDIINGDEDSDVSDGDSTDGDDAETDLDSTNVENLSWQNPPPEKSLVWKEAIEYCNELSFDNHSDWHLPTISELRSLIRSCAVTETAGSCNVRDNGCLGFGCVDDLCYGCTEYEDSAEGCYWSNDMAGPCDWYWSSTPLVDDDDYAWGVSFLDGYVFSHTTYSNIKVRCVRAQDALDIRGGIVK